MISRGGKKRLAVMPTELEAAALGLDVHHCPSIGGHADDQTPLSARNALCRWAWLDHHVETCGPFDFAVVVSLGYFIVRLAEYCSLGERRPTPDAM